MHEKSSCRHPLELHVHPDGNSSMWNHTSILLPRVHHLNISTLTRQTSSESSLSWLLNPSDIWSIFKWISSRISLRSSSAAVLHQHDLSIMNQTSCINDTKMSNWHQLVNIIFIYIYQKDKSVEKWHQTLTMLSKQPSIKSINSTQVNVINSLMLLTNELLCAFLLQTNKPNKTLWIYHPRGFNKACCKFV